MNLDILCITKGERHALPYIQKMSALAHTIKARLVLVVDGNVDFASFASEWADRTGIVWSKGYMESIYADALNYCQSDYILRLDDDETVSPELAAWLAQGKFSPVNAFPRMNLWGDETHFINHQMLYPDFQTRLTTREFAGGRDQIHVGSPYGTGTIVPYPIYHHKFLVKSYAERRLIAEGYEKVRPGAGMGLYKIYSLPEDVIPNMMFTLQKVKDE